MLYSTHPKGLQHVCDIERDGHFPVELEGYPPPPHPPVPMLCPLTSKAFSMSVILRGMGWCRHFPVEFEAYPPPPTTHTHVSMLCPLTLKAFSMSVILTAMGWCGCLPVEFEAYFPPPPTPDPPPQHTCPCCVHSPQRRPACLRYSER